MFVEKLPIPQLSLGDKKQYISFIDKILNIQGNLSNIKRIEYELDVLIYTLYNLSQDEINFIEK
jgi:hypothetical protein